MLLSWFWSGWWASLMIVQPKTVLRWRRQGWSVFWRYRGRRWRGGRPRIPSELRLLIRRMARENFLWGAPRIHGELFMLGFKVSQATVSRYMPLPTDDGVNPGGHFYAINCWGLPLVNLSMVKKICPRGHSLSDTACDSLRTDQSQAQFAYARGGAGGAKHEFIAWP